WCCLERSEDLGLGESEALTFALTYPGYRAMVEDAGAWRCARTNGMPILGIGGALVLAKQCGLSASVAESLLHRRAGRCRRFYWGCFRAVQKPALHAFP